MDRERLVRQDEPWQRGIPVGHLREVTHFFKEILKPYVFGAFGLPNEAEVAKAIAECGYAEVRAATGALCGAAIWRYQHTISEVTDFCGNPMHIDGPSLRVPLIAARDATNADALLTLLQQKRRGGFLSQEPMYVEIFEEDTILKPVLLAMGACYRGCRISAGSEIKGLYCLGNMAVYEYPRCEAASLAILYENFLTPGQCEALLAEAEAMKDAFAQHYSSYNKRKSWTSFALRGYDINHPEFIIKPAEMSKKWKLENGERLSVRPEWTSAAARCPRTMEVVQNILGGRPADRVRFMRLAPKGELSRHADITDREAGVADGKIARLHLPLRTSDKVVFHGWGKRGQHFQTNFPQGALCYLDQRGPHRVENLDPEVDRVHLVLDVYSHSGLRAAIEQGKVYG